MFRFIKVLAALVFICTMNSCSTFQYYAPTPFAPNAKGSGEVTAAGGVSLVGPVVKTSVTVTDNLLFMGQYTRGIGLYYCNEYDAGLGLYSAADNTQFVFGMGTSWGNNIGFMDSTGGTRQYYHGNFFRPYLMFASGTEGNEKEFGDLLASQHGGFKISYLSYNGYDTESAITSLRSNHFLMEMFGNFTVGTAAFKVDLGIGAAFRPALPFIGWGRKVPVKTFPVNITVGFRLLLGR